MNQSSVTSKLIFMVALMLASCRADKTPFEEVYIAFLYNGPKIDTTTSAQDQIIFKNFDGSPTVFVPNSSTSVCDDFVSFGSFPILDTLTWHLRLVDPDGSPSLFQIYFDKDHNPIILNETLHFVKPTPHDFFVKTESCGNKTIIKISN